MKAIGLFLLLCLFSCNPLSSGITIENPDILVEAAYEIALMATEKASCQTEAFNKLKVNVHSVLKRSDWIVAIITLEDKPVVSGPDDEWMKVAAFVNCSWGERRIVFNRSWVELSGALPTAHSWLHEALHAARCYADDDISSELEEVLIDQVTQNCLQSLFEK